MTHGRCAGCGFSSPSCKKVQAHVLSCPDYLALYKSNPAAALTPEQEYERWKLEEDSPESRELRRRKLHAHYREQADQKLARQRSRWQKDDREDS